MNNNKLIISFLGKLDTSTIAKLTTIFSNYRINIFDIQMSQENTKNGKFNIVFQSSSTTDEIDSFWNEIQELATTLNLSYSASEYLE